MYILLYIHTSTNIYIYAYITLNIAMSKYINIYIPIYINIDTYPTKLADAPYLLVS